MNTNDKKKLQLSIEENLAVLEIDIERYIEATKPIAPDCSLGRLTRLDSIQSKSINEAGLSKARNMKKNYERALADIDSDSFGICKRCNLEIPLERLKIMPTSTICMKCM